MAPMHKNIRRATKLGIDSATPMVLANVVRELFQTVINEHGADREMPGSRSQARVETGRISLTDHRSR